VRLVVLEVQHLAACEPLGSATGGKVDHAFDALYDHQACGGMGVDGLARDERIAKDLEVVSPDQGFRGVGADSRIGTANIDYLARSGVFNRYGGTSSTRMPRPS